MPLTGAKLQSKTYKESKSAILNTIFNNTERYKERTNSSMNFYVKGTKCVLGLKKHQFKVQENKILNCQQAKQCSRCCANKPKLRHNNDCIEKQKNFMVHGSAVFKSESNEPSGLKGSSSDADIDSKYERLQQKYCPMFKLKKESSINYESYISFKEIKQTSMNQESNQSHFLNEQKDIWNFKEHNKRANHNELDFKETDSDKALVLKQKLSNKRPFQQIYADTLEQPLHQDSSLTTEAVITSESEDNSEDSYKSLESEQLSVNYDSSLQKKYDTLEQPLSQEADNESEMEDNSDDLDNFSAPEQLTDDDFSQQENLTLEQSSNKNPLTTETNKNSEIEDNSYDSYKTSRLEQLSDNDSDIKDAAKSIPSKCHPKILYPQIQQVFYHQQIPDEHLSNNVKNKIPSTLPKSPRLKKNLEQELKLKRVIMLGKSTNVNNNKHLANDVEKALKENYSWASVKTLIDNFKYFTPKQKIVHLLQIELRPRVLILCTVRTCNFTNLLYILKKIMQCVKANFASVLQHFSYCCVIEAIVPAHYLQLNSQQLRQHLKWDAKVLKVNEIAIIDESFGEVSVPCSPGSMSNIALCLEMKDYKVTTSDYGFRANKLIYLDTTTAVKYRKLINLLSKIADIETISDNVIY